MANVRLAKVLDVDALVSLGEQFHLETPYRELPYSETSTAEMVLSCIRDDTREAFVAEIDGTVVGGACVAMSQPYFTDAAYLATELAWFVLREHRTGRVGLALKQAMEVWAAAKGCKFLVLVTFDGRAPRHYEPIETSFARRLK